MTSPEPIPTKRCTGCGETKPTGEFGKGQQTVGACGRCVRGLLCVPCNRNDVLAGQQHVNWSAILPTGGSK